MKQYGGINGAGAAGLLFLFSLYLGLYHGLFGLVIAVIAKWSQRVALVLSPFRLGRGRTCADSHHRISMGPAGHHAGG